MVHRRPAIRQTFYPSLKVKPMKHAYRHGHKPLGLYMALGTMWLDFDADRLPSHISAVGLLPELHAQSSPNTENYSSTGTNAETEDNLLSTVRLFGEDDDSASGPLEVITISVDPHVFTWDVSESPTNGKILVVDSKLQWDAVEAIFGVPGKPYENPLDWDRISKVYAGIDVRCGETNKLSEGPIWVMGWDVIGPCIWDLAAVESELQVRTCSGWDAAVLWIKAQEAKATSVQVLLDRRPGEKDEFEEYLALSLSTCVQRARMEEWDNRMGRTLEERLQWVCKDIGNTDETMPQQLMDFIRASVGAGDDDVVWEKKKEEEENRMNLQQQMELLRACLDELRMASDGNC